MSDEREDAIFRAVVRSSALGLVLTKLLARLYAKDTRALDELERDCLDEVAETQRVHASDGEAATFHRTDQFARQAVQDIFQEAQRLLEKQSANKSGGR